MVLNLLPNTGETTSESDGKKKMTFREFENEKVSRPTLRITVGIANDSLSAFLDPSKSPMKWAKRTSSKMSVSYGGVHGINGSMTPENIVGSARLTGTLLKVTQ